MNKIELVIKIGEQVCGGCGSEKNHNFVKSKRFFACCEVPKECSHIIKAKALIDKYLDQWKYTKDAKNEVGKKFDPKEDSLETKRMRKLLEPAK